MAMLLIVLSVTAPSLSVFFRGRSLDSEARRFVSLARYGQSRAVSEGVPMVLWMDPVNQTYGLDAEFTYSNVDTHSVEYRLADNVRFEIDRATLYAVPAVAGNMANSSQQRNGLQIRFLPDGFVGESSPRAVHFWTEAPNLMSTPRDAGVWIAENFSRTAYEVQTNNYAGTRR